MRIYFYSVLLWSSFISIEAHASLNNEFVYSQKLGTHIDTVISKTSGLRHSAKTPEGYSFVFGGYLNGAPKIFSKTLYVFKDDHLILINLYADNPTSKFESPSDRNKWTYFFYKALTENLKNNYGKLFSAEPSKSPSCEDYKFYENCYSSYYLKGKKKGIGIYIYNSREVALSYFDAKAVKKLTYQKFLKEARRSLISLEFSEDISAESPPKLVSERKRAIDDPNVGLKLKLD